MDAPEIYECEVADDPSFSGLLLRMDGRVIMARDGRGLSIRLDVGQLRALTQQAALVTLYRASLDDTAAEEATADLLRLTTGSAGHA